MVNLLSDSPSYSLVPTLDGLGNANDDGNYTGQIGLVQREEADVTVNPIILDDLPFEPVELGAFINSKEGVIVTQRTPFVEQNEDVLDALKNFPFEAWIFYVECCFLVVATLLVLWLVNKYLKQRRLPSGTKLRSKVCKQSWNVNMAFLDQVEYSPRSLTKRCMVPLWCLTVLSVSSLRLGKFKQPIDVQGIRQCQFVNRRTGSNARPPGWTRNDPQVLGTVRNDQLIS